MLPTFALAASLAVVPPPPSPAPPRTLDELRTRIAAVLDSTKTPGAGLAIVRHDSIVYVGGIGNARVTPAMPATERTLFRIGSTSKAFVAFVIMQLAQEGKLALDDPITKHLPGFYHPNPWAASDPVRIVHLLEHTTGWDDNSLRAYASNDPTLSLERALAMDSTTRRSRWRPGTRVSYCNTGPAVAARIVEVIEGRPFEAIVQARIFDPAGMRTATFLLPDTTQLPMATLYAADGVTPRPYWHIMFRPAGSINASALDMAAYLRLLLGRGTVDGRTIVPITVIDRMERSETSHAARAGLRTTYGLHLYRSVDSTGLAWLGHGGAVDGGLSDLSYLPEHGVGYAFQINAGSGAAYTAITELVRAFLAQSLPAATPRPVAAVPPPVRHRFSGWYRPVSPRKERLHAIEQVAAMVRISVDDSTLTFSSLLGPTKRYVAVDSLRFRLAGATDASVALVADSANARPVGIEWGDSGIPVSLERLDTAGALARIGVAGAWLLALPLTLVACVVGAVRRLVSRARRRAAPTFPAGPAWRVAALSTGAIAVTVLAFALGMSSSERLGTPTVYSVAVLGSGVAFAACAAYGLVVAWRRPSSTTRWQQVSGMVARTALMLHAAAAAYLVLNGVIGWRTWV